MSRDIHEFARDSLTQIAMILKSSEIEPIKALPLLGGLSNIYKQKIGTQREADSAMKGDLNHFKHEALTITDLAIDRYFSCKTDTQRANVATILHILTDKHQLSWDRALTRYSKYQTESDDLPISEKTNTLQLIEMLMINNAKAPNFVLDESRELVAVTAGSVHIDLTHTDNVQLSYYFKHYYDDLLAKKPSEPATAATHRPPTASKRTTATTGVAYARMMGATRRRRQVARLTETTTTPSPTPTVHP